MHALPVVIIGAGPQGLAAAAHLLERGQAPLVLEAGARPADAVEQWAHVRLFSDWSELVDEAAARLLERSGWVAPGSGYPTGREWIDRYLAPLATALGERVRYGARVTGVARRGRDLVLDSARGDEPFTVHVVDRFGTGSRVDARAVVDASGTWSQPNPAGADGYAAMGERESGARVSYRIPDVERPGDASGGHTVVVGSGHSAMTAVNELARLARLDPAMRVTWVLRRGTIGNTVAGAADALPQRGALGARARQAVDEGVVGLVTGFLVSRMVPGASGVIVVAEDGRELPEADRVVVLTGFRPDLSFLSELRLDLDAALESPTLLAAEIDPTIHTCGTVRVTGATELAQPERDFFIVGAKSYGRAPTFLARTGYEQVRSVTAALAGMPVDSAWAAIT